MYHKRQVEAKQWHLCNYFSPDITKTESNSLYLIVLGKENNKPAWRILQTSMSEHQKVKNLPRGPYTMSK